MNEMNTLTLNDKTYDSFRDQQARQALEKTLPGPACAFVGQHLQVAAVDEAGKVTGLSAVSPLAGSRTHSSLCSFLEPPAVTFDAAGYSWWKVSALTPDNMQTMDAVFISDLGETAFRETPDAADVLFLDEKIMVVQLEGSGVAYAVCRATGEQTVTVNGVQVTIVPPETGIYMAYAQNQIPPESWVIGIEYEEIFKLDARYLPATAASKAYVHTYVEGYLNAALGGEY